MADEKNLPAASTEEARVKVENTPDATQTAAADQCVPEEKSAGTDKISSKESGNSKDTVLTVIGIILCVILTPILIANLTMILKSYVKSDEVPSIMGYCPFVVLTDSMSGTIEAGDLILDKVVTEPADIRPGDIISFFDPSSGNNGVVTHRVVEVVSESDGILFRTKGDANNTEDDDLVPCKNVVGIYAFRIKGAGNVVMFMQSTPGLVVCVALPILLLIGYDAFRRSRYERQQRADTEALKKELEKLRRQQQGKDE